MLPERYWEADCLDTIEACFHRHQLDDPQIRLLVAVSGGPDSMALARLMQRWAQEYRPQARLQAAIVDHGLRPESAQEALQTVQVLDDMGIEACVLSVPSKRHPLSNVQATARQWRFEALAAHAERIKATAILLGHHQRDQAETVIDRLARGSHMVGLSAMAECRMLHHCSPPVMVLRPLLSLQPGHLRAYAEHHGLGLIDDPSNQDRRYRRVRLRQMILQHPPLQQAALRLQQAAARHAGIELAAARQLWSQVVRQPFPQTAYGFIELDQSFCKAPSMLQWRVMGHLLRFVAQQEYPARHRQLQALCLAMTATEAEAAQSGMKSRCLSGVVISSTAVGFCLYREKRFLQPSFHLHAGDSMIWDHRLEIKAKCSVIIRQASPVEAQQAYPDSALPKEVAGILCVVENMQTSASTVIPSSNTVGKFDELRDVYYRWCPKVPLAIDLYKSGLLFSKVYPI